VVAPEIFSRGRLLSARSSIGLPLTEDQVLAVVPASAQTGEGALSGVSLPGMTLLAGDHPGCSGSLLASTWRRLFTLRQVLISGAVLAK